MSNDLHEELLRVDTLEGMESFLADLKMSVGICGGRKYEKAEKTGSISLNEITRQFKKIADEAARQGEEGISLQEISREKGGANREKKTERAYKVLTREERITHKILELGEKPLAGKRALTKIHQIFGGFFYDRGRVLAEINKRETPKLSAAIRITHTYLSGFHDSSADALIAYVCKKSTEEHSRQETLDLARAFLLPNGLDKPVDKKKGKDKPVDKKRERVLLEMARDLYKTGDLNLQNLAVALVAQAAALTNVQNFGWVAGGNFEPRYRKILSLELLRKVADSSNEPLGQEEDDVPPFD